MKNQATVLVVDDEAKILDVVESYLNNSGYKVFTARTGSEAMTVLQKETVSLLLLDLMLPDLTGEEICKKVRETSDMPVIMMTAKVGEESIVNGLSIGADDYITKPFSPRQLMARVAAVLRRSGIQAGRVLSSGALTVDTEMRQVCKSGDSIGLTPNEYKILALLISRPHKIFTRDEIITHIKADAYGGFDRTVDSHIKNLRQKIEDDPKAPAYILTVYGMGYRFGGEVQP